MGDDHGLQGDGDHLGVVVDQPGHPQQQLFERRRCRPGAEPRQPNSSGAVRMDRTRSAASRSVTGTRRWAMSPSSSEGGAGQAEGEHGAGRRVDGGADDGVDAAGRHRLDDGAQLGGRAEEVGQLVRTRGAVRSSPARSRRTPPRSARCRRCGRGGLQGDRVAEPPGGRDGRVRVGRRAAPAVRRCRSRRAARGRRRGRAVAPRGSPGPRRAARSMRAGGAALVDVVVLVAPARARRPRAATGRTSTASARARTARSAAG